MCPFLNFLVQQDAETSLLDSHKDTLVCGGLSKSVMLVFPYTSGPLPSFVQPSSLYSFFLTGTSAKHLLLLAGAEPTSEVRALLGPNTI